MKRVIFLTTALFLGLSAFGQVDTVDIGTTANDGTGDDIRTAFGKHNTADLLLEDRVDSITAGTLSVTLATLATTVTVTDNESTAENNPLVFVAGGDLDGGSLGLETDGTTYYTPSTGTIVATAFTGTLTGAASLNVVLADSSGGGAGTYVTGDDNITSLALKVTLADSSGGGLGTYVTGDDNINSLALKSNIATPSFTTSIAIGSALIEEAELEILDGATITTSELNVLDDAKLDTDIVELFTLSIGTALGSGSYDSTLFVNGFYYGGEYNSADTLYVTQLTCAVAIGEELSGSTTIQVDLDWDVNMNDGTPTQLNSSPLVVTSTTTGTIDATFDADVIDPATFVWWRVTTTEGRIPSKLVCTASGYVAD